MNRRILFLLLACLGLTSVAGAQTTKMLNVPGGGRIQVNVPMGYDYKAVNDEQQGGVRVHMENPVWGIVIDALVLRETDGRAGTAEWQEDKLISIMAREMGESAEADYKFMPLPLPEGTGRFCSFTHRNYQPGVTQGGCVTGGIKIQHSTVVAFRILSNDLRSQEYREALEVFTKSFSKP